MHDVKSILTDMLLLILIEEQLDSALNDLYCVPDTALTVQTDTYLLMRNLKEIVAIGV